MVRSAADLRLVVFDCDGTLVDSQRMIVSAMNLARAKIGLEALERTHILSIVGLSLPEAMRALDPGAGDKLVAALVEAYRAAFTEVRQTPGLAEPMYNGMADLVRTLAARNDILLGIATGKSRRGVARVLEHHGLADHFVTIHTADTHPSKPHPDMLLSALRATGIAEDRAVMIGDTTFDVDMAHAARVASVGVAWGYHTEEALRAAGPTALVQSPGELASWLAGALALEEFHP